MEPTIAIIQARMGSTRPTGKLRLSLFVGMTEAGVERVCGALAAALGVQVANQFLFGGKE